jgi:hypothetical protein
MASRTMPPALRDEFPERQSFPLANSPHGLKYASDCDQ